MRVQIDGVEGAPHLDVERRGSRTISSPPRLRLDGHRQRRRGDDGRAAGHDLAGGEQVKIGRYGAISLVDFGAGNGTPLSSDDFVRSRLVRAMGALLNNPGRTSRSSASTPA